MIKPKSCGEGNNQTGHIHGVSTYVYVLMHEGLKFTSVG